MTIRFEPLESGAQFKLDSQTSQLTDETARTVDQIWEVEQGKLGGKLYDGSLVSVKSRSGADWTCEIVPYRRLVASINRPELADAMQFHALGVTGCVECSDGYVMGKRGVDMLQEAGLWEFAPAGGLDVNDVNGDRVDPLSAFQREWTEETGAPYRPLNTPRVSGLVTNGQGNVSDLIVSCKMSFRRNEILECHSALKEKEYSQLRVVSIHQLANARNDLAEVSQAICDAIVQRRIPR